ncbi:MAG: hypothetical protein Salg2KO_21770 [Salibacteraceae bacterium]
MSQEPLFYEKQYLGFNRFGLVRRMVIILFCFIFYFASGDTQGDTADLFFYLGVGILVMSGGAMLISHLETRIEGKKLILKGPMTHRRVEMELSGVTNIEVKPYSKFIMNRPMFNLHRNKARRFYTHGAMCVEFTSPEGETIKLGSQRPEGLKSAIEAASKA